jgi:hypothetical protein
MENDLLWESGNQNPIWTRLVIHSRLAFFQEEWQEQNTPQKNQDMTYWHDMTQYDK